MTFPDLLSLASHNLLRMKLRTFLTITGVVIAIAAFVALLSFGAGNQKYVTEQFESLGLFTTMIVYPPAENKGAGDDSTAEAVLDDEAIGKLAAIQGVELAYPFDAVEVTATLPDTQIVTQAQALPAAVAGTRMYATLLAGQFFSGDTAHAALVTDHFLELIGIEDPDSVIGLPMQISARRASLDSGLAAMVRNDSGQIRQRFLRIRLDSLMNRDYRQKVIHDEVEAAAGRFFEGLMNRQEKIIDTLVIAGVIKASRGGRLRTEPIIIPAATARRFTTGGISTDPAELMAAVSRGGLFGSGESPGKSYSRVTLSLEPRASHKAVRDSVEALGFRAFSFAEQFDQMRKFFFYFDLVLGVIGAIALIIASLGIINTMFMSIIERTREIGVLKALGCDDRDVRLLFLIESGVIGAVGSVAGIVSGWIITRIASLVSRAIMQNMDVDSIELFALPLWLIVVAFVFGLSVSILAGSLPARRAARVDPVTALRND